MVQAKNGDTEGAECVQFLQLRGTQKVDFEKRVIIYENQVYVEDFENHFRGVHGLFQTQS